MAVLANYLIYYANKNPAFENCPKNAFLLTVRPSMFCSSTHDGAAFPQYSEEQRCTNSFFSAFIHLALFLW